MTSNDQCEANNDIGLAEQLRDERGALLDQLERATGLGNRPRTFTDDPERARTAVRKAIAWGRLVQTAVRDRCRRSEAWARAGVGCGGKRPCTTSVANVPS